VGIVVGCVVILGLIVGGLVVVLTGDEASADEVFLEPAGSSTEDPFTDSTTEGDEISIENVATANSGGAIASVGGDEVGLYGGTQDAGTCDRDQLVAFLEENDEKAAAWARVQGIPPSDIADFVADLTPVRLRADTRVTNHGFRDGEANPIQSVLQAGTAVLVDDTGLPRVKCSCGNPLLAPREVSSPSYDGPEWDGFSPDTIQVVVVQQTVDVLVLVDVDTGDRFERPVGTDGDDDVPEGGGEPDPDPDPDPEPEPEPELGEGDVQFTLRWSGEDDLDLHVLDPAGEEIYYAATSSSSGGQLDVDAIPSCGETGGHVENVFWPTGAAPSGEYEAYVTNLGGCSSAPADYTLEVRSQGELVDSQEGTLAAGETSESITLEAS
jgi:hypothetical protein